ncbi:lytic transglycosylase domain-containing protein [Cronobacter sakazakii]|uniref:lytic transglycosylase domain-containing protein n=1 Tax=Cronobacter sakazakii TaxID=28141 RepID=UPI001F50D823|nr:lytic transglycosylase domain-containing protein [Cronobacter sakazakii]MCI0288644.1 lytic transglycosylase domain-containing protein [Cronobacter sakazakii]MDI7344233.1 lytic transglycosylase domain-containing protein [Cronobacter sakazakii]MDI7510557.1 lytic transglycosylase domain-containing protein [Cronobacter sakazakii]MDI7531492.1 lytic transglycosylase domain-containing protein [Cronobacter sakazakii]MDI7549059.1 lytic transglycosylase domain-containing protein [Cronobacter sakazaki
MANYRDLLEQAGARHGVPEGLMTALGAKESSYNHAAVSSAGAVGLTQVMPGTWRDMGYTDEQMQSPEYQADAGARYLAKMYQQFGNWRDALQAYHDGPGNVMKAKRGEYTPGPEGRGYVDDRFSQWAGDPVTDSTVEQRATSAKVHPQEDPNNPFAQLETQASAQSAASNVQSDPNNPFAQIEQQATSQQPAQPVSSVAPKPVQQQGGIMSDLGNGLAETGRGLLQAGINVANIPAELTDAVTSAAAWAGNKLGIGDGTYQPAPRVTTQGLEQDFGLRPGTLTPQTTEGRIFAEALPYLTPVGIERAATAAPTLAGRIAEGGSRLLAENAVGSLAANSDKNDAGALATDLGLGVGLGAAANGVVKAAGAGYRALTGSMAPEAAQAIRFAEQNNVPLTTTDVIPPTSRVGRAAQTTAENIPFVGTSGMRAAQQESRSQLVQNFANKFGEYNPAEVVNSLKAKTSGIKQAAGRRLEQVQSAMSGVSIQPSRAIQQIDDEVARLQKLGGVADTDTISKLQAYRDELAKGNVDLEQLSNLRSQFRMDVKGERPVMPTRSDAAVQRVYRAMTGDIDSAIGQSLGNDVLRRYRQANAVYADEAAKLQNTRLKNVLMKGDLTPEVVNNMLFSKNRSEIQSLYNSVGQAGRVQMRNGIIGKAMEKSGGSPDQFLRQLNIMSNQTGIAFKGEDAAYIRGLKNYLESTKQAARAGVSTPTGQQAVPLIMGFGAAANPTAAAAGVSYGLIARMYESKAVRNAMLRLANTPRGSSAFEKAAADVAAAIKAVSQGAKSDALAQ